MTVAQAQLSFKESARTTRPEIELLLCCARTQIDPITEQRIQELLQEKIDWTYLIQASTRQAVTPLLYRSLNTICPEAVPKPILSQLRNFFHTNAQRNLSLTAELLNLLKVLQDNDIPAIPLKGPSLAISAYGNLALRQFADLDILVSKEDIEKAGNLLVSHSYQLYSDYGWQQAFFNPDNKINVDLHQALALPYFVATKSLDFASLWQRAEPLSLLGTKILNLSIDDMLMFLLLQVLRDSWNKKIRLYNICDIAEILLVYQSSNWNKFIEKSNILGINKLIFACLLFVHQIYKETPFKENIQKIQIDWAMNYFVRQMIKSFWLEINSLGNIKIDFFKIRIALICLNPILLKRFPPSIAQKLKSAIATSL